MSNPNSEVEFAQNLPVRREKESVDDFEHLGLDNSPIEGDGNFATSVSSALGSAARDLLGKIDLTGESVVDKIADENKKQAHLLDSVNSSKMDSNLYEMGDALVNTDSDEKMDHIISQLASFAPSVPSHEVSPIIEDRKPQYDGIKDFLNMEREHIPFNNEPLDPVNIAKNLDFGERELVDLLSNKDDFSEKHQEIAPVKKIDSPVAPIDDLLFSEVVAPLASKAESLFTEKPISKEIREPFVEKHQEEISQQAPSVFESFHKEIPQTAVEPKPTPVKSKKPELHLEPAITDAEAIFKKMGLDAWFHPERLNPKVESLIYWRDPAKSAPIFGGVLVVLIALTYLSLISVVAYVSLLALTATISFRIYKNILQAVQKTGDGHPFKEFLDKDIALPQDKVKEVTETAVAHLNAAAVELRRLFLVDDLVDSIKFGVLLWCLTYLGSWFNGMTLVIIAWVALFTLPKVYETNKTQIDANLDLVRSKIAEITSKVKAAIPIGKKEEKKEQ